MLPSDGHTPSDLNTDGDGVHNSDLIGIKVRKQFTEGWFGGEVIDVSCPDIYEVKYEDDDVEKLERIELYRFELAYDQHYMIFFNNINYFWSFYN